MSRKHLCLALPLAVLLAADAGAAEKKRDKRAAAADPYAELVWPPPPNEPRIKLEAVLTGRADVEAGSRLRRILIGAGPQSPYDTLRKPFAVEYDSQGRLLVTDWGNAAAVRFDRGRRRFDVLGTRTNPALKQPLGLEVGRDDSVYVADVGLRQVVKMSSDGKILAVFGRPGELTNPTDAALSPDGSHLYVADSRAHRIVIFDEASAQLRSTFGQQGSGEGDLYYPTSLEFDLEGNLLVVDQMNARVQLFAPDGEYLDGFGGRGVGFGNFSRPKDVAVDGAGLIYVTDNAFNNVQLFDSDFTLLSFIGETGSVPGRFWGASGVAARGDEFAVVDQIGARVQVFRYLEARDVPAGRPLIAERPSPAAGSSAPPGPPPVAVAEAAPATDEAAPPPPEGAVEAGGDEQTPPEPVEPVASAAPEARAEPEAAAEPSPPPAAAPAPAAPAVAAPPVAPEETVARFVDEWRLAWAEQRLGDYLASYGRQFRPGAGLSRETWEAQRRQRLMRPAFIEIAIRELEVELVGADTARARFLQLYRSDRFSDRVRKTLELVREDGGWRIVGEAVDEEL